MKKKSIIISIKNTKLSLKEKKLIKEERPWGIILFKRNIKNFNQLKKLVLDIKKSSKDKNFPILIDEEGGTVSRLSDIIDNKVYSQKFFGDLHKKNSKLCQFLYKNYIFSLCSVFKTVGININTVPVLDILKKTTNKIIGTRSFSYNKKTIIKLGKICLENYFKNKVGTVIKHMPGHGCASSDSHIKLPIVNKSLSYLKNNDFGCFKNSKSFFGMTAHILYKKIDKNNVATHSNIIIKKVIRDYCKFNGILISDDISMKALKYDIVTNAQRSLDAGCNLVLYCGGKYSETKKLLKHMPFIDSFTIKKTSEFYKFLS